MARRAARPGDIHDIAMSLPEVTHAQAEGDYAAYQVQGQNFIIFRGPRQDLVDPATGKPLEDIVVFTCPNAAEKAALVRSESPFFTLPHFDGYNAVLLRLAHIGELSRDELAEVIADAWLTLAPRRLAIDWLSALPST